MQNDLLETGALVSLLSILFCQVGRQRVPGVSALKVGGGEMAHRKGGVHGPRELPAVGPLPAIFLAPGGEAGRM